MKYILVSLSIWDTRSYSILAWSSRRYNEVYTLVSLSIWDMRSYPILPWSSRRYNEIYTLVSLSIWDTRSHPILPWSSRILMKYIFQLAYQSEIRDLIRSYHDLAENADSDSSVQVLKGPFTYLSNFRVN